MTKPKIISNPKILGGKPIISGTRISVELIMNFLAAGMSVDQILTEYNELKRYEVLAAIEYAAKLVSKTKRRSASDKAQRISKSPARANSPLFR